MAARHRKRVTLTSKKSKSKAKSDWLKAQAKANAALLKSLGF